MSKRIWALLFILFLGSITASGNASAQAPSANSPADHPAVAPGAADTLKITFGDKSESWTAATLAALPHSTLSVYNAHAEKNQNYSGVPLIVLLARLGVPDKPHGKDFHLYLLAEGADGYAVVYSVGEVTPDLHDGTTLVADAMDGKPLVESGPLQLVTSGDKRPARWVRNLVSIRVLATE